MNIILDLIYPNVCGLCNEICKNSICEKCEGILKRLTSFNIVRYNNKEFSTHIFFCIYDGIIREKILEYKFKNKAYLYKFFSEIITKNEKEYNFFEKYDIITSVPIHRKRKLQRGYNQTELIAKKITRGYKEITYLNTLKKIKHTSPQSALSRTQREKNIKNVYKILNVSVKGKKILLFDDIYTTGATVNECSRVLRCAGAKEVAVVTIAKD